jgi:hypothetical protein
MKTLLLPFAFALVAIANQSFANQSPAAQEGENVTEAMPLLARATQRGGLSFGGAEIDVVAYAPGWSGIPIKSGRSKTGEGSSAFEIRGEKTYFKGSGEWTPQPDGSLRGHVEAECVAPVEVQCLAVAVRIPAPPPFGLGHASAATFDLPLDGKRTARLSFPEPVPYHSQDSRQWSGQWTVRFGGVGGHLGHGGIRTFSPGERIVWDMTLTAPDGVVFADPRPLVIDEGTDWVRLDYRKDIEPRSALDLSGQGLQDAPAGKHGWLKAVGGHFEFEGLPGVEQRFYGVNLCFTANYPAHDIADRLVDRFVRCGYNSIRVHHHDGQWAAAYAARQQAYNSKAGAPGGSGGDAPSPFADDIDRLDYLLARCYERGIYVTTDLYVSRPVAWRDIGIDRDGAMDKPLYKTYVGVHDGAFANWCHWAQAFLEHVNPYTGRAAKDEPGMPLISLINEGRLLMGWGTAGKGHDPVIREAWRKFGGVGETPKIDESTQNTPFSKFDEWINRRIFERGSAFVRSLGCRALLTNDNNGRWHGEGEGLTPLYDYVDSHFYVDHPQFLEEPWKLPSRCGNANPVKMGYPAIFHRGWSSAASSKPCAITEWNFSGPGRYRGMGGILTGAFAAEQRWDGLWRFAYSHSNRNLLDGQGNPGYFDCVTDPLIAASDRASVCLYLRGDALEGGDDALAMYKDTGSMVIITPQTCGGFSEGGTIDAGVVKVRISGAPATVWASSLDGCPLNSSSRVLLTHLTDVQANGNRYLDESRRVLLARGAGGALIERGEAEVALKLDRPDAYDAYELDLSGSRRRKLDASVRNGHLVLAVGTAGPDGGRIYYEIVRSQRKKAGHAEEILEPGPKITKE